MEITIPIDELSFEKWAFTFLDGNIFLDSYYLFKKETKRHRNYQAVKKYSRIMGRNNSIKEEDVPLSDYIKKEAFNAFVSDIKVLKWSER